MWDYQQLFEIISEPDNTYYAALFCLKVLRFLLSIL